jgi:hypothetical protein
MLLVEDLASRQFFKSRADFGYRDSLARINSKSRQFYTRILAHTHLGQLFIPSLAVRRTRPGYATSPSGERSLQGNMAP